MLCQYKIPFQTIKAKGSEFVSKTCSHPVISDNRCSQHVDSFCIICNQLATRGCLESISPLIGTKGDTLCCSIPLCSDDFCIAKHILTHWVKIDPVLHREELLEKSIKLFQPFSDDQKEELKIALLLECQNNIDNCATSIYNYTEKHRAAIELKAQWEAFISEIYANFK